MSDETRMWTELGRLGEDPLPGERSDADLVAAALAGLAETPAAPVEAPARSRAGSRVGIGVGLLLAVAAAVLLGWWLLPTAGLVADRAEGSGSLAPSLVEDDPAGGQAAARERDGRAIAGRGPHEGASLGEPSAAVTAGPDAGAEAATPGQPVADAAASASPTSALAEGPGLGNRGPTPSSGTLREPSSAISRHSTAPALLEHAARLVSKGERTAAIAAYERLLERFPESREAAAGLVSLGRLELDRGRASQALARFDAYLAGSAGALVEEARYGRIRALRQLGRLEQELRSIEAFLADHPDSLYAARLRKRAEELRAP